MKTRQILGSGHTGSNEGWAVVTTLLSGFVVWGGIGWLLDHWWDTKMLTPIGLIVGMALGIYAVVARFGLAAAPERKKAEQQRSESPAETAATREETTCP